MGKKKCLLKYPIITDKLFCICIYLFNSKLYSGNQTNLNTLTPRQSCRHFTDDIFKWKCLSEPMMVNLLTHICVTQPHWVNSFVVNIVVENIYYIIFTWYDKFKVIFTRYAKLKILLVFCDSSMTYASIRNKKHIPTQGCDPITRVHWPRYYAYQIWWVNALRPSDAYMCHHLRPSLV